MAQNCAAIWTGTGLVWSAFCGWSGNATIAAPSCPSTPSGKAWLRVRWEARCCDPSVACLPASVLSWTFVLCLKQQCPTVLPCPCQYREGWMGAEEEQGGNTTLSCCKKRQALLLAAVPVLRDHAHLLFFHLFT